MLKRGHEGASVEQVQHALNEQLELDHSLAVDGIFGRGTESAVRAFQQRAIGPDGRPLQVDGVVGPLTRWALFTRNQADAHLLQPLGYPKSSFAPRCALSEAVVDYARGEMRERAREIGENNGGPFVERYAGREGVAWCAHFVSYVVELAAKSEHVEMPFHSTGGARNILRQLERKGLTWSLDGDLDEVADDDSRIPRPGDLVFWWRDAPDSWKGHVEIVVSYRDGQLWTIGGNRGSFPAPVRVFSYVVERERKMLGFGRLC